MPPDTLVAADVDRPPAATSRGRTDRNGWRRVWDAPLWAHAAILLVALLALVPVVGIRGLFSGDEGALAAQTRALHDEGAWSVPNPFPEVDPDGRAFPYDLSQPTDDGAAPFVKHPAYPWIASPLYGLGALPAVQLLSVLGGVAAALAAAGVARVLRPGLERPTLWIVGLASPLLFDSYLLIAHTLGAAAATGALLAGLVAVERRRPVWAAAVLIGTMAAGLVRNEAVLYGLALAGAFGVVGLRRRDHVAVAVAVLAVVGAVAAKVVDGALSRAVVGQADAIGVPGGTADGLSAVISGRVGALLTTLLAPGYGGRPLAGLLVLLVGGCLLAAALVARRPVLDRGLITGLVAIAATASVVRVVALPAALVPGLFVAFPLLAAGLCLLRRDHLAGAGAHVAATVALFVAAVAATQYASGGSGEWGGRYFALGVPAMVPLALAALADAGARLGTETQRRVGGGLAVVTVCLAALSLLSLRAVHRGTDAVVDQVATVAAGTDPGDGGTPVVLTTAEALPRLSWEHVPDGRWLLVTPRALPGYAERLDAAGVRRLVFAGDSPWRTAEAVAGSYRVVETLAPVPGSRWTVQVLEAE